MSAPRYTTAHPSSVAAAAASAAPIAWRSPDGVATTTRGADAAEGTARTVSRMIASTAADARCSCAMESWPEAHRSPTWRIRAGTSCSRNHGTPFRAMARRNCASSSVPSSRRTASSAASTVRSTDGLASAATCESDASSSEARRASSSSASLATMLMLRPWRVTAASSRNRWTCSSE